MRILIGSDAPSSLFKQVDIRSWTQRIMWFVEEGDTIIVMSKPDEVFVEYVTGLLGVAASSLNFLTIPGRWEAGNFDAWALLDKNFQEKFQPYAENSEELVALWPVPEVGWLAGSFEIEEKLAGNKFLTQGGGLLVNSKVFFRMLASGVGVEIPNGGVCYSADDAFHLSGYLLKNSSAFVVKQNHAGGGQGNEIVSTEHFPVSHSGHSSKEMIESKRKSLEEYWERRWSWASGEGSNPVVLEAYIPNARTLYVEFQGFHGGLGEAKIGEIKFENGKMSREIFPAQNVVMELKNKLEHNAKLLAEAYYQLGYRGPISLDCVVTTSNEVYFTEANARYTSSTHLYAAIGEKIVGIGERPDRIIVQGVMEVSWRIDSFKDFLEFVAARKLAYHPVLRTGIIAVTPLIGDSGNVVVVSVAETEASANNLLKKLNNAFLELNKNT